MTVPFLLLGLAAWQAWGGVLSWPDLVVAGGRLALCGVGVTVGFHRLFTHRSFKTRPAMRLVLGVLGSAAVEGPLIEWVSNHRKHHRFSDEHERSAQPPRPRRRAARRTARPRARPRRLDPDGDAAANPERYAKDLLADPVARFVDRTFVVWALAGLAVPFALGCGADGHGRRRRSRRCCGRCGATLPAPPRDLLDQLALPLLRPPARSRTGDESRNLAWLAMPTFGEAWHNNHHAFPTAARHGQRGWQLDPSWWVIRALERSGLAWDVVGVSPARQAAKLG